MIPLKDDVPSSGFPFVTIGLIVLNVLVFLYQASIGMDSERAAEAFILEFGAVPCRVTGACSVPGDFPPPLATIFTSMFMHGGLFHVAGNMLYLWIFGDNVEDTLGHGRFLVFYLVAGVAAALAQVVVHPGSRVPMVGASGAVSGVLGAYLLLFPYDSTINWNTLDRRDPQISAAGRLYLRLRARVFGERFSFGSKNVEADRRQSALGRSPVTVSSRKRTAPRSGTRNPLSTLNSVVLPAPLGPITLQISPWVTLRLTPETALRPPKLLLTFSTASRWVTTTTSCAACSA